MGVDYTLMGLYISRMLVSSSYSVLAPFYPQIAKEKGLSGEVVGMIFSCFPLVGSLAAPILGLIIPKTGRRRTLLTGCFIMALSMFGFGTLPAFDEPWFTVGSFTIRSIQGLGDAMVGVSCFAIVASHYKERLQSVYGMVSAFIGIGMLVGPLLGAILYAMGGFTFLFFSYGFIFLILLPVCYKLLPEDLPYEKPKAEINILKLIFSKIVILDGLIMSIGIGTITFLEPIFSDHLKTYGLPMPVIGLMFTVPAFSFTALALFIGKVVKDNYRRASMLIGLNIVAVAMLFVGPWSKIGLPHSIWLVLFGLVLLGIGHGVQVLPVPPDMVSEAPKILPDNNPEHVSDAASGLVTTFYCVGEIIGPPVAGFLRDRFGFENSSAVMSAANIGYAIIFGILAGGFTNLIALLTCAERRKPKSKQGTSPLLSEEGAEMASTGKQNSFYQVEEEP